jgi:hypothetical protein
MAHINAAEMFETTLLDNRVPRSVVTTDSLAVSDKIA